MIFFLHFFLRLARSNRSNIWLFSGTVIFDKDIQQSNSEGLAVCWFSSVQHKILIKIPNFNR